MLTTNAQRLFITSIDRYKATLMAYRNRLDTLTGLPLRQLLYKDTELRMARSHRDSHAVYLLMLDIDRFKSINDTYGHNAGDEVLKAVAHRLRAGTRATEALYRFGGEEFIALFDAHCDSTAAAVASRLCRLLSQAPVVIADGSRLAVTATGGLTQVYIDEPLHDAIGRADKAMYRGKSNGRNRFVMSKSDGNFLDMHQQAEPLVSD
ncbi:MAG: diguanylate cyclase domain-containing protein [Symbiopectobacterium sp.]|uniref:diguanylate cyclase domain-containing protein n=1 Tax=Symbiopectobacterium sp. TaxID=2952789 RepID=UPI0039EC67A7